MAISMYVNLSLLECVFNYSKSHLNWYRICISDKMTSWQTVNSKLWTASKLLLTVFHVIATEKNRRQLKDLFCFGRWLNSVYKVSTDFSLRAVNKWTDLDEGQDLWSGRDLRRSIVWNEAYSRGVYLASVLCTWCCVACCCLVWFVLGISEIHLYLDTSTYIVSSN